jgi:hypothetical protein
MEIDNASEEHIVDESEQAGEHDYTNERNLKQLEHAVEKQWARINSSRKKDDKISERDLESIEQSLETLLKALQSQFKEKILQDEANVDILNKQKIIITRLRGDLTKLKKTTKFLEKELNNLQKGEQTKRDKKRYVYQTIITK